MVNNMEFSCASVEDLRQALEKNDLLTVEKYRKLCKEKVDAAINETNRECTLREDPLSTTLITERMKNAVLGEQDDRENKKVIAGR